MRLVPVLLALATLPAAANTRLALHDGEVFTFRVSWVGLGAGEIKISAQHEPAPAPPRLRVTTTTATRGFARMLLPFEAKAESIFDAATGRLGTLTEWSKQREKTSEHTVTFDYAHSQAHYSVPAPAEKNRTLPMPAGEPMDLITQLVQTREWALKPGEKRDALVLFDDDFYELTLHAARYEDVTTSLGKFKTLVLEPRMDKTPAKGMFRKGSKVRVWIAIDDVRRLPVKFEVEFKIGTGVATLTAYQPPSSAKVNPPPTATEATKASEGKPAKADKKPDAKNPRS